jgi:hypothetical protein
MKMEEKIRKAVALANDLAGKSEEHDLTFTLVFNAMLAGTVYNPWPTNSAVRELSDNLGKWLGVIAEAIVHSTTVSSPELAALAERLKASRDSLQSAVERNTPEL